MSDVKSDFETWWFNEGSAPPKKEKCEYDADDECFVCFKEDGGCVNASIDWEAHCKKMCEIAWSNGSYLINNKCLCTFAEKLTGDGCRYCNPEYLIEVLSDEHDELCAALEAIEPEILGIDLASTPDQTAMVRVEIIEGKIKYTPIPESEWRKFDEGSGD